MTDIKQTLAAAFADEPPLAVDKAALITAGRRRSTARRASLGAAVALAVAAVVAVPIVVSSGGGSSPVAQSGASSGTATGIGTLPPQGPQYLPAPKPVTAEHAAELSDALSSSGVFPPGAQVGAIADEPSGVMRFAHLPGGDYAAYKLYNRVVTARGSGGLMIWLDTDQHRTRSCADQSPPERHCEERQVGDRRLVIDTVDGRQVGFLTTVTAWLPDGSVVLVQSSTSVPGEAIPGTPAPFEVEELVNIATQPWLTF